jgi:hypothetical protein
VIKNVSHGSPVSHLLTVGWKNGVQSLAGIRIFTSIITSGLAAGPTEHAMQWIVGRLFSRG